MRTAFLLSLLGLFLACGEDDGQKKEKTKEAGATAGDGTTDADQAADADGHVDHDPGEDCPAGASLHECEKRPITEEEKKEYPDPVVASCADKPAGELTADITESKTLTGVITVKKSIKIAKGASVVADDCASLKFAKDVAISVEGSLSVKGKEGANVGLQPLVETEKWGGLKIKSGGKLTLERAFLQKAAVGIDCEAGATACDVTTSTIKDVPIPVRYASVGSITDSIVVQMDNKGFKVIPGGDLTVTNSHLYTSTADVVGQSGGKLRISKSKVGGTGYEHCAIHVDAADLLEITDSIIQANAYAFMLGGVTGAKITNNNIQESKDAHVLKIGEVQNTNLTGNYWEGGVPQSFLNDTAGKGTDASGAKAAAISGIGPTIKALE